MTNICGNIALVIGLVAAAGIFYTLGSKHWKHNSQVSSSNILRGIQSYEGLWVRCSSPEPGTFVCDNYDISILGLPPIIQALRAVMCIAGLAAVGGVIAGLLGLDCVSAVSGDKAKNCTGRTGGFLLILAGLLCLGSVSWYAVDVVNEFSTTSIQNSIFVYEFGSALWVGWIASVLAILSGSLFICGNCGKSSNYRYQNQPMPRKTEEYI